jgi:hypothetical protein
VGRMRITRWKAGVLGVALAAVLAVPAYAAIKGNTKSEHWGVITRNTIGSPVAQLRDGPYGSFGVSGPAAEPPFGKGSLGIEVADSSTSLVPASEKASFGNEVDFFGENVLDVNAVGFHVFQTGENVSYGGPRNLPNIAIEMDANLATLPADNYTTMVWAPGPLATPVNQWSPYIDATTDGNWYFTGAEAAATGCTQALNCTFAQAMAALDDGGDTPVMYTLAVAKGRDSMWIGAVDGLRLNNKIYDFEANGVKDKNAK